MLAVTIGDANGVGPAILLKAFKRGALTEDFIAIGDLSVLELCNERCGYGVSMHGLADVRDHIPGKLNVLDMKMLKREQITPGRLSAETGIAAKCYIVTATDLALRGFFSAIVTLPVNKESIRLTDADFTGHTELIAGMCGKTDYTMMLASPKLTVTHVSTHVSMEEAVRLVKKQRVFDVIRLTHDAVGRFKRNPHIAVAGLNAHAGEGGAFGGQEIAEIKPAVKEAQAAGMNASGPYPPDTVFLRASRGEFDAVVCMYHDQGHIPMKLLDFEGGVNVTLGLDIVRTSVDHGTAYDIAWSGNASDSSFVAAFDYAKLIE